MSTHGAAHRRIAVVANHAVAATSTARHAVQSQSCSSTDKKVCIVLGAGAGIGINVGKRFAKAGMVVVLARRSDNEGLEKAVAEIKAGGGEAHGFLVDAIKPGVIEDLVKNVETNIGPIHVAVYNLGAQIGGRSLEATTLKTFEQGWRLGNEGLFRFAKELAPHMTGRGTGTVLCTSATSAMRGNAGQHSHAASIGGRRLLLQSLNHELGPKGLHFCHIIVDTIVDAPDTFGKLVGKDNFEKIRAEKGDSILKPQHVAETYYHVHMQHRSAWTFELDVRPYDGKPWWN